MGKRRRYRAPTVLAAALAAALLQALLPATVPGDGLLYDLALAARARLLPAGETAKVAVVAVESRSLATPRLARSFPAGSASASPSPAR